MSYLKRLHRLLMRSLLSFMLVMILSTQTMFQFIEGYSAKPLIISDKAVYDPFATAKITIVDQAANYDREKSDVVTGVVHTTSNVMNAYQFREVAPNTGIFQTLIRLTPDPNTWIGDLVIQNDDIISIQYSSISGSATANVKVDFSSASILFDKAEYFIGEEVKIFVLDSIANKLSDDQERVEITVWSNADVEGLKLALDEIGPDVGIFARSLSLVKDQTSSGTILKSADNDIVTAKYESRSLPLSNKEESPTEVKELIASVLIGQMNTEREIKKSFVPQIADRSGNPVSSTGIMLGKRIIIQDSVVNTRGESQEFVYLILIKNMDGITVSLSYTIGEVPSLSTVKTGKSWLPTEIGEYEMLTFLWQNLDSPVPLESHKSLIIKVTDSPNYRSA